jgi:uncharacterized protein YbaP (TraB family)
MVRFALALVLICVASISFASSAVWEISNGTQKFWLGASLGALKKTAYPLPPEFDDAFRRSDKLYVERDINAVNKADFGLRAMQASAYTDGRTLKTVLTPANWQALEKFAQARNVPTFTLLMFKPAFVGFTFTALEAKRLELGNGVDAHYFYRAINNQKPVATLETLEQQIQYLQKINELDPNMLIQAILAELGELSVTLDLATTSWRAGDIDQLDKLKGKKLRDQAPDLYRELVVNRSKAWMSQFKSMLKTPEIEFVLVDAVHFSGPDNLLQLLKAQGYTVRPYKM